jgi:hypothetical protein
MKAIAALLLLTTSAMAVPAVSEDPNAPKESAQPTPAEAALWHQARRVFENRNFYCRMSATSPNCRDEQAKLEAIFSQIRQTQKSNPPVTN